ncbi:MAG TPA: class II glutamine amidotransferase [Streptosporangiaceae bacterium]|jgi:glutamine amidotransferase
MCRLFGLTAGTVAVSATFWLLDAPDSLEQQSHRNADGSGIGYFDPAGRPVLDKQPVPAFTDQEFIREARQAVSAVFVAHVRLATAGGRSAVNTHPFAMQGQIMAHNGSVGDLASLDAQLGPYRELVLGDTDSERYFALITQQIDAHGGDVAAGITAAASWIAGRLPVSSLNTVVAARNELWALRYPASHALHILERPAGDSVPRGDEPAGSGQAGLRARSSTSSVRAPALQNIPTVVIASEELDGETGWRMLAEGELVHIRPDLTVESSVVLSGPPARLVPVGPSLNIDS